MKVFKFTCSTYLVLLQIVSSILTRHKINPETIFICVNTVVNTYVCRVNNKILLLSETFINANDDSSFYLNYLSILLINWSKFQFKLDNVLYLFKSKPSIRPCKTLSAYLFFENERITHAYNVVIIIIKTFYCDYDFTHLHSSITDQSSGFLLETENWFSSWGSR